MASESPLADKKTRIAYNRELRAKGVPAKACSACFAVKALTQFNKDARSADGRHSRCRDCDRAAAAKWGRENADRKRENMRRWYEANAESQREYMRRWYEANAESQREYARQWREANPEYGRMYYAENAESRREYMRKYRAENAEELREYSRQWRAANPEYTRQWRAANPEKARAQVQRRRARKAQATVEDFTPAELFAAWEDAAIYACYLCGLPFGGDDEVHLDHVVPLASGGTHEIGNLLPAHGRCNVMKHAADPLEAWQRIQRETHGDAVAEARARYVKAHTA